MTDEKYISGIKRDDHLIIGKFYSEHMGMIRKLVSDRDSHHYIEFDDLYIEVITIVLFKIKKDEITIDSLSAKLSTYIYSIARNKIIDAIRKKEREIEAGGDIREALTIELKGEDEFIDYEAVLVILKTLNPPCYELLLDRYIHKIEYDTLADKYGYSNYNSVKKKKGKCIDHAKTLVKNNYDTLISSLE